ncbi:MAG: UDP-3-O-[3-hydroxymyristoyl] N-acetylglucosamine deacetylase [Methylothermaceae bacteria B42]|nr:MAG: UDP-3-O-[3-hydroxymyristoyl] N-acetylglucosamine deacetylase [Methylothermaceae bacteria B42]HHJ39744.1 UDP-3-O-acyl-N-acetylglucosamine deacetylase [Methylothermaceae bacterium]
MIHQRTLRNPIRARGIGLHSGRQVCLTLRPAPANTGIVFRRIDLPTPVSIPARGNYVGKTLLSTALTRNGTSIATVEHLLAAFSGLGVDNAFIDIDAPEVPIMDGSAAPFVFLIQSAGLQTQNAPKYMLKIRQPVCVKEGDKWVALEPYHGFKVKLTLDFDHPVFSAKTCSLSIDFTDTSFTREVARARTFGFLRDVEKLRRQQLALGGSLKNSVVIDDQGVINKEGLRYPNEFVRHKILDAIGDLYLLGHGIQGAFAGFKSGHSLNIRLIQALLQRPQAWEIIPCNRLITPEINLSPEEPLLQAC